MAFFTPARDQDLGEDLVRLERDLARGLVRGTDEELLGSDFAVACRRRSFTLAPSAISAGPRLEALTK